MYLLFHPRGFVPAFILSLCQLWWGTAAADPPPPPSKPELRFLNWSEYMDPGLLKAFEERFNIKVTEVYFETDEMRDDMLLETDSKEIAEAEKLLLEQKPYVKAYAYPFLNENSALVTGEIHAAMMFNGDVLMVQEHHPEITYVLPKEGGNVWVDYLAVGQASERKALAYKFIDFLNEPAIAARLAQFVYYATPNKAAEALLPKEFLEDPAIYPSPEVLKSSEVYPHLPPRALKRRNGIFARLLR